MKIKDSLRELSNNFVVVVVAVLHSVKPIPQKLRGSLDWHDVTLHGCGWIRGAWHVRGACVCALYYNITYVGMHWIKQ